MGNNQSVTFIRVRQSRADLADWPECKVTYLENWPLGSLRRAGHFLTLIGAQSVPSPVQQGSYCRIWCTGRQRGLQSGVPVADKEWYLLLSLYLLINQISAATPSPPKGGTSDWCLQDESCRLCSPLKSPLSSDSQTDTILGTVTPLLVREDNNISDESMGELWWGWKISGRLLPAVRSPSLGAAHWKGQHTLQTLSVWASSSLSSGVSSDSLPCPSPLSSLLSCPYSL